MYGEPGKEAKAVEHKHMTFNRSCPHCQRGSSRGDVADPFQPFPEPAGGWIPCGEGEGLNWVTASLPDGFAQSGFTRKRRTALACAMCLWQGIRGRCRRYHPQTQSDGVCGCQRGNLIRESRRTHGMSRHPAFGVWHSMKQRCEDPNHRAYHNYGGRGISVCPEWSATSFD